MTLPNIKATLPLVAFLFVDILYLATRVLSLDVFPIFGDEAIYVRWSQIIKSVETLRFIPLTDGKQPLFMWVTVLFFKLTPDPLVAGRLVSVIAGLGNIFCLCLIVNLINPKNLKNIPNNPLKLVVMCQSRFSPAALIVSAFYLLSPYTLFFDRLALADNLLTFWGLLSFVLAVLLSLYPRFDLSILLGVVLGLAYLTKSPALFFVILSFITYIFLNRPTLKNYIYPLISVSIAYSIYNLLRLGPQFHQIAIRNRDYIWPFSSIVKHPLDPLFPHLTDAVSLYRSYLGLPVLVTFIVFLILTIRRSLASRLYVPLILWWGFPLFVNLAFSRVFTARYILYATPYLFILLALMTQRLALNLKSNIIYLVPVISLIYTFPLFFQILTKPLLAISRLPGNESGYLTDWTSGWGVKPVAQYLINRAKTYNVIVGTEGYFGTLPDGLQVYTNNVPKLTVFGVGLEIETVPDKLVDARNHEDDVYLLINRSRHHLKPSAISLLDLVYSYPKPNNDSLDLYRLR